MRNRITGSSGAQKVVAQGAARIEEAGAELVANVVAVADSGALRAVRVVLGRAGTACAGLVLRQAHLRRHWAILSTQEVERIQEFRQLQRRHRLAGVYWTVEGGRGC